MDWTKVNAGRLATVHPIFAARVRRLIEDLAAQGIPILVVQALRTWDEQNKLYAQGRTTPGNRVTNARGGSSWHNYGLAVDVVPDDAVKVGLQPDWNETHPSWTAIVKTAAKYSLVSGATWTTLKDFPHLQPAEIPASPNAEATRLYMRKGMDGIDAWFENIVSVRERASSIANSITGK